MVGKSDGRKNKERQVKPEVRLVHKMSSLERLSLISLDLDLRLLVVNVSKDTWATSFSALRILHLPS